MDLVEGFVRGRRPWRPIPDAQNLNIWLEYEHPRIGTFAVAKGTVLFTVVGAIETDVSVWAYACLTPEESLGLDEIEFGSMEDLQEFVDQTFATQQTVLALADDLLITSWAAAGRIGPLYEVASDFLEPVLAERLGRLGSGARFRAKLAATDVAIHELLSA
jgi:hypothetical protein